MREIFIGCDIAKSKIDFCILNSTRNNSYYGQFENNEDGFEQFLKTVAVLHPLCEPFVTMESTSSYTFAFQKYLAGNSINHVLLNARRANKYIKSMVIQGKTDKTDAFALSHFCSVLDKSEFTQNYSSSKETLTKYVSVLRQIRKQKTQVKNLYKAVQEGEEVPAINLELVKLKKELKKREDEVYCEAQKVLRECYPVCDYLIESHQGVNYSLLLSLVPRAYDSIENYSVNSTVAFFGLNPTQFQSGTIASPNKLNMFGSSDVKHKLYMSVFSNLRYCELTKRKYDDFKSRGKTHKQAMVALMRQLLVVLIRSMRRYKKNELL